MKIYISQLLFGIAVFHYLILRMYCVSYIIRRGKYRKMYTCIVRQKSQKVYSLQAFLEVSNMAHRDLFFFLTVKLPGGLKFRGKVSNTGIFSSTRFLKCTVYKHFLYSLFQVETKKCQKQSSVYGNTFENQ